MKNNHLLIDPWKIIENTFDKSKVKSSESLFSIGNGYMGQRANFEEDYSGNTFQGSYIGGVYYPDKTKVGWWKNGYPESFAKVLNAPNWIGISIKVNGELLDLNKGIVKHFQRVLDMQKGIYKRKFQIILVNGIEILVEVTRFISLNENSLGGIEYKLLAVNTDCQILIEPYIDAGIVNQDSNWDDSFWKIKSLKKTKLFSGLISETNKTKFEVCTYMANKLFYEKKVIDPLPIKSKSKSKISQSFKIDIQKGKTLKFIKIGGYVKTNVNFPKNPIEEAKEIVEKHIEIDFEKLLKTQIESWKKIWEVSDIKIEGDPKSQQAIRYNIFQLNQTYSGKDPKLNISPKGFTGEKYGGSTYWDTEAYCLPFYMLTKDQSVSKNLLKYRYFQLDKAIENAEKLGFDKGAALFPMVTMNGEECHNEWEITFEEIHRNGAIVYAMYNYLRYTKDFDYIKEMGIEVLIAVSRFWAQRFSFSRDKNKYVILGVTGPNEYENNVNNNWYTNYIARWCLIFTKEQIKKIQKFHFKDFSRIIKKTNWNSNEFNLWDEIIKNTYLPYDNEKKIFLQQDGFLDKELIQVSHLKKSERPINQNWSWDRILRSVYIKQADVLQGFYFFSENFSLEELKKHYKFYEPFTVHESSLSPSIHAILASRIGMIDEAYKLYLQTSRLDLDDYNIESDEGLHITSMAGSWLTIIEGFGGMKITGDTLYFENKLPKKWKSLSFKINIQGSLLEINLSKNHNNFIWKGDSKVKIIINGK
ncbi:MAG: family 65 glycosyl hydrolase domain-containing protein [Flavobacteriaceae bacterium]|nr:family 65 glycosyl hydrolase domain-containing protein [Flavobacteriaceae bacterium]